jgi:hypothetical protein
MSMFVSDALTSPTLLPCPSHPAMSIGSRLRPVANEVVIDARELDSLWIIPPEPLHQCLDRRVEIEDQAAGMRLADHALQPEERGQPRPARHWCDQMQAGGGIDTVSAQSDAFESAAVCILPAATATDPLGRQRWFVDE